MATDELLNQTAVIPSEVENGAAGEAATWTQTPEAERTETERIKSRRAALRGVRQRPSSPFHFAQDDCLFGMRARPFLHHPSLVIRP